MLVVPERFSPQRVGRRAQRYYGPDHGPAQLVARRDGQRCDRANYKELDGDRDPGRLLITVVEELITQ